MQSIISISSHRRTFGNVNLIQTRIKIYVQLCHSDYYRLRDLVVFSSWSTTITDGLKFDHWGSN